MKETCSTLGIPLIVEKVDGLHYIFGITLNTQRMVAHLPEDNPLQIRSLLVNRLSKRKVTKRELLSLVGLLQHAKKPDHTFVARMYCEAAHLKPSPGSHKVSTQI